MLEHGTVDAAQFGIEPASVDPLADGRIGRSVFQHEYIAMRVVVVLFVRGAVVQPPFAVEEMQLGRPDRRRVRALRRRPPDHDRLRLAELGHVGRLPQGDAVAERVHVVVDAGVGDDPRIGAGRQQRFRLRRRCGSCAAERGAAKEKHAAESEHHRISSLHPLSKPMPSSCSARRSIAVPARRCRSRCATAYRAWSSRSDRRGSASPTPGSSF